MSTNFEMTRPPADDPTIAGYQHWRHLLFAHWRVAPAQLQTLLPPGLTIETFDDSAWLAVVPFSMERIRPWWSPAVPGISWFLETNLRTYVRHASGRSGVWFFSLDANHRLAVWVARKFWHLNYQTADLFMGQQHGQIHYQGLRKSAPDVQYDMKIRLPASPNFRSAEPETLEHFLLERYHLIARRRSGQYCIGQVHHDPYQYVDLDSATITQTLCQSLGNWITAGQAPDHLAFSPGVNVAVSPLRHLN